MASPPTRQQASAPQQRDLPKMNRIGIPGLDEIVGGGLPSQSNVLVYGDPLCGKKPLVMQFIYEGLKRDVPGIFVLTDYGWDDWKAKMASSGWNLAQYEETGMIQVIDCYSKQFDPSLEDAGVVSYAENPAALSSISLHIARVQDQLIDTFDSHRLVFHSISSLLKETDSATFFRFMQFAVGKFRRQGATAMYVAERGMHDERDVKMMEHLVDGVIEFEKDQIRARGLPNSSNTWHHYEISDTGVLIRV